MSKQNNNQTQTTERLPYFAYGSNMSELQMTERTSAAVALRPAKAKGFRLAFVGESARWGGAVATLLPKAGGRTWGILYDLTDADEARIDACEGVALGIYKKVIITLTDGTKAFTYLHRSRTEAPPSARYLATIRTAREEWDLPTEWLDDIQTVENAEQRLFVYGTLQQRFWNHRWLEGRYLNCTTATTVGILKTTDGEELGSTYAGKYIPVLHLGGDYEVEGELYWLRNARETLAHVDHLEGVAGTSDLRGSTYERRLIQVRLRNGRKVWAWAYPATTRKEMRDAVLF